MSLGDFVDQLVVVGKLAGLFLAVDQLTIDLDLENTAASLDQLAIHVKFILESVRQTDGFGGIVSLYAVFDRNVHG